MVSISPTLSRGGSPLQIELVRKLLKDIPAEGFRCSTPGIMETRSLLPSSSTISRDLADIFLGDSPKGEGYVSHHTTLA